MELKRSVHHRIVLVPSARIKSKRHHHMVYLVMAHSTRTQVVETGNQSNSQKQDTSKVSRLNGNQRLRGVSRMEGFSGEGIIRAIVPNLSMRQDEL